MKYLLIVILQTVSLVSCYLFTKSIHFIVGVAPHFLVDPMINVYGQNMPLPSELIPVSRAPAFSKHYAQINQPHGYSEKANLVLIFGGKLFICAFQISFCISGDILCTRVCNIL